MSGNLNDMLKSDSAKKILGRKDDIAKAASTKDGNAVMESLQKSDIEGAIKRGDTAALKSAIEGVMKTEEGARFLRELGSILGKKNGNG